MRKSIIVGWMSLSLFGFCLIGCEPKTSPPAKNAAAHDHDHDHPKPTSLAEALKTVDTLRTSVKDAFANKKPEDAHDVLHEIGHAIETLQEFALKAAKTDEAKESAKSAVKDLFDSFGLIDQGMHGKEGKTYEEVAAKVDAAIATLTSLAK